MFRAGVRRALAAPLGGPLGRIVHLPAVTAVVTDGRDEDREVVALAEVLDALVRVGVPRGRQFVLLAHPGAGPDAARERTRRLRGVLGVPVLGHDPDRGAAWVAGTLPDGTPLELDDDLREAEEVVLVGGIARDPVDGLRGGPAALWPGMGSGAARRAHATALAGAGAGRPAAALARARAALACVPSALAVLWDAADPPRVRAGATLALLERCEAEGWFGGDPA